MAQEEDIDVKKFHVGFIGNPPQAILVQIPIEQYGHEGPDGLDMFYGKMKRIEAMGAKLIRDTWEKKQRQAGLIKPNLAVS